MPPCSGALDLILEPHLGKDTEAYHWRSVAFLQRVLTERPARWLPADFKNYDELLSAAADQAVKQLEERTSDKDTGRLGVEEIQLSGHAASHRPRRNSETTAEHHGSATIRNGMEPASRQPQSRPFRKIRRQPGGLGQIHHAHHRRRIRPDGQRTLSRPVSLLVSGQSDLRTVLPTRQKPRSNATC